MRLASLLTGMLLTIGLIVACTNAPSQSQEPTPVADNPPPVPTATPTAFPPAAPTATPIPTPTPTPEPYLKVVGRWGYGPSYALVAYEKNDVPYVFVGSGGMILAFDVSTPLRPTLVSTAETPGVVYDLAISQDRLYVADMEKGLRVLDISDPRRVHEVGAVSLAGEATGVAVSGSYAYVTIQTGIQVVDVSRPEQPKAVFIASTTSGRYWKVTISGSYAYVTNWLDGLLVYDLKSPASPVQVGAVKIPSLPWDVAVSGNFAYVATEPNSANISDLQIIDVSKPSQPVLLASLYTLTYSRGIAATEGRVYLAGQGKFGIVDVLDPISPRLTSSVDLGASVSFGLDLVLLGSAVYVADYGGGLTVVETATEARTPLSVGWDTVAGSPLVRLEGNTLYVGGLGSLWLVDISNPATPMVTDSFPVTTLIRSPSGPGSRLEEAYPRDLLVRDGLIYLLAGRYLYVIDASDPFHAREVWSGDFDGALQSPKSIAADAERLYVLGCCGALITINILEPEQPVLMTTTNLPIDRGRGLLLRDSLLYVVGEIGGPKTRVLLLTVPPSDPTPNDLPYYQADSSFGLVVLDNHVYVVGPKGIGMVEFPESSSPRRATIFPEDSRAIKIFGNEAYVLTYEGLMVLDLAAPTSLSQRFPLPGLYGTSVAASQEYVVVSTKEGGVVIFKRNSP